MGGALLNAKIPLKGHWAKASNKPGGTAMHLDQSIEIQWTLQQRSPPKFVLIYLFIYFITTRKRKQKIFANALLLSSILLVACSEDDSFPQSDISESKKGFKNELYLLLLQQFEFQPADLHCPWVPFPRQLWQALWEQWEIPGMGLSLWFLGPVRSTAAGQQGIRCCHLPGSSHALCSLEGRGQQREERKQKECLGVNWLKSSSPCEPVNLP